MRRGVPLGGRIRRPAHATTIWTRDWPADTSWAWSCVCGAGSAGEAIGSRAEAKERADAHLARVRPIGWARSNG